MSEAEAAAALKIHTDNGTVTINTSMNSGEIAIVKAHRADIRRSQMFKKFADIRRSQMLEKGKQRNMLMSQNISMKSGKNKVDTPARTWSRSIHAF